jgi:hypothetical protein
MLAIVGAGAAISRHGGHMEFADLGSVLAHLGSRLHAAESLDIPEEQLLAFAREIQRLAEDTHKLASSSPIPGRSPLGVP